MLAIPEKVRGYNDDHLTTFKKLSNGQTFQIYKDPYEPPYDLLFYH
ncbi:MAG: hypothetical protein K0R05_2696 [Anaerocolumna sp.]|jgi:hypothetical protein|nr:hypothetical protein [Anaerocolumna sp.]